MKEKSKPDPPRDVRYWDLHAICKYDRSDRHTEEKGGNILVYRKKSFFIYKINMKKKSWHIEEQNSENWLQNRRLPEFAQSSFNEREKLCQQTVWLLLVTLAKH